MRHAEADIADANVMQMAKAELSSIRKAATPVVTIDDLVTACSSSFDEDEDEEEFAMATSAHSRAVDAMLNPEGKKNFLTSSAPYNIAHIMHRQKVSQKEAFAVSKTREWVEPAPDNLDELVAEEDAAAANVMNLPVNIVRMQIASAWVAPLLVNEEDERNKEVTVSCPVSDARSCLASSSTAVSISANYARLSLTAKRNAP